jgi:hypothetical protein
MVGHSYNADRGVSSAFRAPSHPTACLWLV